MEQLNNDSSRAEGVALQIQRCPNCGNENSGIFCSKCGTALQSEKTKSSNSRKKWFSYPKLIAVVVICLAIGGIAYFVFPIGHIKINSKNFPDATFREKVKEFDKNKDNKLSVKGKRQTMRPEKTIALR